VTAETINVPPQPAVEPRAAVVEVPSPPAAGPLWRRAVWRAVLVPLTVLTPIVALAPTADHRFNIYWHGGMFRDNPLGVVTHTLSTARGYLTLGNFRPLGRMLEKTLDLAAYTITDLVGLPVNVSFRLVSFVGAVVLTVVAMLFAESFVSRGRLFRQAPSTLAATVPFAVGGGFIAAGSASPTILFTGLYLLSAALVAGVAAAACRVDPERRRVGWWRAALLVLAGAALASFNEVAYLALPFATVAVLLRGRVVLGLTWRRVLTGVPARVLLLLWTGFLPVFAAVRAVIYGYCADGECYQGSDIALGPDVLAAEPVRMIAWLPPLMWHEAAGGGSHRWLLGLVTLAALVMLSLLAWRARRDLPRLSTVDRRQAGGLAATAFALLILGATLGSLNAVVQQLAMHGRWGAGWRDTAITAVAGALMLVAVVHAVTARRLALTALIGVLAVSAAVSTSVNRRYADRLGSGAPALIADRLAVEMAGFDPRPAGNARRCALRAEFRAMYADSAFTLMRFDQSFDVAAHQMAGVPFCE
jgi:hypothetical protein